MTPREVVDTFGQAWADHDLDAAVSMLTEDAVFDATSPAPDGTRIVGREAIRRAWEPIFDDPAAIFEVEETIEQGDRMTQLWCYRWNEGHVRGVDVLTVLGDQISAKLSYVKG